MEGCKEGERRSRKVKDPFLAFGITPPSVARGHWIPVGFYGLGHAMMLKHMVDEHLRVFFTSTSVVHGTK